MSRGRKRDIEKGELILNDKPVIKLALEGYPVNTEYMTSLKEQIDNAKRDKVPFLQTDDSR